MSETQAPALAPDQVQRPVVSFPVLGHIALVRPWRILDPNNILPTFPWARAIPASSQPVDDAPITSTREYIDYRALPICSLAKGLSFEWSGQSWDECVPEIEVVSPAR
ncbi:hypothetical protein OPQ81_009597 [Rhizoctonia solani]|nr:hypothetical protein OPQ81_009597 [Rhizoctonia solani]